MKKNIILFSAVILFPVLLFAQVPKTLNFQGVLTDPLTGQPVADNTYEFEFLIWDASSGGNDLWGEVQDVPTNDGLYNVVLGAVEPLALDFDSPYWVEVTVEGETLSPRIELTAPAYVLNDPIIDLSDGSLKGSKVGSGISASNVTTGTMSGLRVGSGISGSNVTSGTVLDARLESTIDRTIFNASDYITALGGIHVGGTSNPGTDNLYVDGLTGIGVAPTSSYKLNVFGSNTRGVNTVLSSSSSQTIYSLFGQATQSNTSFYGAYGVYGTATNNGGSGSSFGVRGVASGTSSGTKYGVYGSTSGTGTRYGVYCSGNGGYTGTWSQVSDRKFKTDILRMESMLERIMLLKPSTYLYKVDEYNYMGFDSKRGFGLIAQEAELIFPEMVTSNHHPGPRDKEGKLSTGGIDYKGIDYIKFTPVIIRAIQEQNDIIVSQANEIAILREALLKQKETSDALKSENSELGTKLNDLTESVQEIKQLLNLKASAE